MVDQSEGGRVRSKTLGEQNSGSRRTPEPAGPARPPKLLDRLRQALRSRHYSRKTEQSYCSWVRRFIRFHNLRHPDKLGEPEINAFLSHLALKRKVSASTQTQALSAILFLYRRVLKREIAQIGDLIQARRPRRLPVVMTLEEANLVLGQLDGQVWLMASLM